MALLDELASGPSLEAPAEGFLAAEARMLAGAKKGGHHATIAESVAYGFRVRN